MIHWKRIIESTHGGLSSISVILETELLLVAFSSMKMGVCPDSKVHGANMGPIWGRQDPGGTHVGPMNFAIWVVFKISLKFVPGIQIDFKSTFVQVMNGII